MLHLLQLQSVFLLTNLSQVYRSQGWSLWQQQGLGSLMPGVSTASWPPHNHWLATSARVGGYLDLVDICWCCEIVAGCCSPSLPSLLLCCCCGCCWCLGPQLRTTPLPLQQIRAADVTNIALMSCLSSALTHNAGVGCDKMPSSCNVDSVLYHNRNQIHMPCFN